MKIAFVGGGNMAQSLIGGLLESGTPAASIVVSDPLETTRQHLEKHFNIGTCEENQAAIKDSDVVVLAVKPQQMDKVISALSGHFDGKLLISVAAGVLIRDIVKWSGKPDTALVRSMPNTPALIGCGATGMYANEEVSDEQRRQAESILSTAGIHAWVDDESQLDAITALSGSGPAYFFLMLESMIESAEKMGIAPATAKAFAIQTALGAARMAGEVEETPAQLRRNVTSPAGTTEAALASFDNDQYREIVHRAMLAASRRAKELGEELGTKNG